MRVNREFQQQAVVNFLEQVDEDYLMELIPQTRLTVSTDEYNEETQQVFRDIEAVRNLTTCKDAMDLYEKLGI